MDFVLIDFFEENIDGTKFDVVVLYEQTARVLSKAYFKHTDKTGEKLQSFFNDYCYSVVTPYVKYKMNSKGKIGLQLSI